MQQIPTNLIAHNFTEAEELAARTFSPLQIAFLQTELTAKAQARLALNFDTLNPYAIIQEDAYLKGQMEFIESLLAAPEAVEPQEIQP